MWEEKLSFNRKTFFPQVLCKTLLEYIQVQEVQESVKD